MTINIKLNRMNIWILQGVIIFLWGIETKAYTESTKKHSSEPLLSKKERVFGTCFRKKSLLRIKDQPQMNS